MSNPAGLRYFMPDWGDSVDPGYDFIQDSFSPDRDVSKDSYAHELFSGRPYDGILVSRAVVEKATSSYKRLAQHGAHSHYRLLPNMEVFGDCGAFEYVNEYLPRYDTEDVLEYYEAIGVDYGASVDHLVVNSIYVSEPATDGSMAGRRRKVIMSEVECQRRVELTLENAQRFLTLHKRRRYTFVPVGVAQGWTAATYSASVRALARMGYRYIALGGLARSPSTVIMDVLQAAARTADECAPNRVRFHLFGVAKLGLVGRLRHYAVASIDSASYLRKAWLRSGQNYLTIEGEWYTAIRVPQSSHPKVRAYIAQNGKSLAEVQSQEQHCLRMLERYDRGGLSPEEVERLLDAIVNYDMYLLRLGDDGQSLRDKSVSREKYRHTLLAKPWRACTCEICRALGIHVVIFRGTNRNKRRGFHNTWAFYQRLKLGAGSK